jgi:hypothetical protein
MDLPHRWDPDIQVNTNTTYNLVPFVYNKNITLITFCISRRYYVRIGIILHLDPARLQAGRANI